VARRREKSYVIHYQVTFLRLIQALQHCYK
jgi:hypothetical protein